MNRKAAVIGAVLVPLGVVGLWALLDTRPTPGASDSVASAAPASPSPSPPKRRSPERRAPLPPLSEAEPGQVVDVEVIAGSTPVEGAQVQLYWSEPGASPASPSRWRGVSGGETGADGRWQGPARAGSYFVTARAEGFAPTSLGGTHPPGQERTSVRLYLETEAELVGSILSKATGEPVALAEVLLTPQVFPPELPEPLEGPEEEQRFAMSSPSGEFFFTGLAPGRYRAEVRASGYLPQVLPSLPVPFGGRVTLELASGSHLEGIVLSADGQPQAEAEVVAFGRTPQAQATTDAEGRFSLDVPAGTYSLSAQHGTQFGELGQPVTVSAGQQLRDLRITLSAGASISGWLRQEDGTPILGGRVEASPHKTYKSVGRSVTDASGAFSLSPLVAGTYDLRAVLPSGKRLLHEALTVAPGEHATVTLTANQSQTSLELQVTSLTTPEHPLEGCQVKMSALQSQAQSDSQALEGRTDAQGLFSRTGLEAGLYRLEVQCAPGAPGSVLMAAVRQNQTRRLTVKLPGAAETEGGMATIEGRVLQRSGTPVHGPVTVQVQRKSPERPQTLESYLSGVLTDEQGRFRLVLPPGPYLLSTWTAGSDHCSDEASTPIQVEADQRMEVTLHVEQQREPVVVLHVQQEDGTALSLRPLQVRATSFFRSGYTDALGQFALCAYRSESFPSGPWVVESLTTRQIALPEWSRDRDLPVRLRSVASVRGRLISVSGAPVRRFHATLWSQAMSLSLQKHEFVGDQFEFQGVPAGQRLLSIQVEDGRRAVVSIDLQPGRVLSVEVPVDFDVPLTGRLVDATTRAPLSGVHVSISMYDQVITSPSGRFSFRLPPGEHLIHTGRGSSWAKHSVKLTSGRPHDMGDIPLAAP
ncbi:carboxypeptidase-like regulatory domain-containing protein [Hyalangium rubrum]|uniref:Carboxypeptidase-like regulatory domain-containing protein n=1 Tax=Hyalangium rubrum TaxID=3103134 RepID=A0ABU5HF74_9BACT|nr:carboxypeptidase-like regulatory domain-containing protein [Hyalangium sp. s54d21]MDY7232127.1 carboxypeptidase-like regulatory domain-containing protein [Hyalangium sp. s54d21]